MTEKKAPNSLLKAVAASLGGSLIVGVVLLAFVWPTKTIEIHNLPVAISGPKAMVSAFETKLEAEAPGKFKFEETSSRDEAAKTIETRKNFGAIILAAPNAKSEVIVASAANTMVAQQLTNVAQIIQTAQAAQLAAAGADPSLAKVEVTNLVQLSEDDPTGSGLSAAAFPLTLGGIIGGLLMSILVSGRAKKLLFVAIFAPATGLVVTTVMQNWFGFFQGSFWTNSLAVSASIGATALLVGGLQSLLGQPGLGLASAFTMLVANPLASASLPWQFIAQPWGEFGQYLIPGASNWLLRSLSYFPDADLAKQWWTLVAWIAVGVIAVILKPGQRSA